MGGFWVVNSSQFSMEGTGKIFKGKHVIYVGTIINH